MQLLPIWLVGSDAAGVSMATDITSASIQTQWKDNVGIHVTWTGTPTGTIAIQVSNDPDRLGWQTITFTNPTPDQPAGSSGNDFFEVNQTAAGYIRLIYTAGSGTGTMLAKISAKSV